MDKTVVWHSVHTNPKRNGFYFCWHSRWGRVVLGYRDGWGQYPPDQWMDDDGLPDDSESVGAL